MGRLAVTAAVMTLLTGPAMANEIERACLRSDRPGTNRSLCGCIQDAANLTLNSRDQRLAATFFANPDRAQQIRSSSTQRDEVFWKRYENFGKTAEHYCRL